MSTEKTLTFVGTGAAADPELPNTSLLYRGSCNLLLDCGYSVPQALWRVNSDAELLDGIVISHRHGDHSFGLPGLLLWLRESGRQRPVTVFGAAGVGVWLDELTDFAYRGFLHRNGELLIEPVTLVPDRPLDFGGLTLNCARSDHSDPNLAVRVDDGDLAVCFSGDGGPTPATANLYQNATLLAHECYAAEPGTSGHADYAQVVETARQAGVQRLALVHLGSDEREAIAAAAAEEATPPELFIPAPGDSLEL